MIGLNNIKFILFSLIILQGLVKLSFGQNLVPNPSFENMKKLPSCQLTLPKDTFESFIYDWMMPTQATPDIYSSLVDPSCLSSAYSTAPSNIYLPIAHRSPRTGNNFAGMVPTMWYREYLEVKLKTPLEPGQIYCCEMYVSRSGDAKYAQDCIGMYFSDKLINNDNMNILPAAAQVKCDSIIEDSVNWVRISGSFKATSPAQYLLIGNFCMINETNLSENISSTARFNGSYYYIDDISVEKLPPPPPLIITGKTTICPGEQLKLTATGRDNIKWVDINTHRTISKTNILQTIPQNGVSSFIVRSKNCKWDIVDTVHITYNPVPNINLGNDTLICQGSTYQLNAGTGLMDYFWQDSSTAETFNVTQPGTYTVKVTNTSGCKGTDSIKIGYYLPPKFSLGEDQEQCTPVGTLSAYNGRSYERYLWQDGSTKGTYEYQREGTYWAKVDNICGMNLSDTIHISKIDIFIPNMITPNQDGLNDELKFPGTKNGKGSISIYNRMGTLVYENKHYEGDWSGSHLTPGIYYFVFSYPTCEDKKEWVEIIK